MTSSLALSQTLLYEVAITFVPKIGDVMAKILISYCGSPEAVFKEKRSHLQKIPGIGQKIAQSIASFKDFSRVEKELLFMQKHHIRPLFYLHDDYPGRLKPISDAPLMLYYLGNADLNNPKIVGIIGTRKASDYGKAFIDELCMDLKHTGCLIISGLAYGADIHAHRAALHNGLPTAGIMAHGLDRIYPQQHQHTAKKMIENGGLLTEFPSTSNPDRENFPKRNRIVAGLCDVLVIAETGMKGGSMITTDIANSYNKDIMALPGRVTDPFSAGCNHLIRSNKAAVITCAGDLIELMNWDTNKKRIAFQPQLDLPDEAELRIISYIRNRTKAGFDDISLDLGMNSGLLSLKLLDLELKNLVRALPGKYYELNQYR